MIARTAEGSWIAERENPMPYWLFDWTAAQGRRVGVTRAEDQARMVTTHALTGLLNQ